MDTETHEALSTARVWWLTYQQAGQDAYAQAALRYLDSLLDEWLEGSCDDS